MRDTIESPVVSATKMIVARMFFCYLLLPGFFAVQFVDKMAGGSAGKIVPFFPFT